MGNWKSLGDVKARPKETLNFLENKWSGVLKSQSTVLHMESYLTKLTKLPLSSSFNEAWPGIGLSKSSPKLTGPLSSFVPCKPKQGRAGPLMTS